MPCSCLMLLPLFLQRVQFGTGLYEEGKDPAEVPYYTVGVINKAVESFSCSFSFYIQYLIKHCVTIQVSHPIKVMTYCLHLCGYLLINAANIFHFTGLFPRPGVSGLYNRCCLF